MRTCGHRAIRFGRMIEKLFWKLHRPRNICDAPIKFTIDEISAAAKEQTNWRSYDQIVAQVHPRNLVPMRVIKSEEQQPDHPAMARHSAFPHAQNRQRLAQHFGLVEKDVSEPTANDHTEKGAPRDEISDSLGGYIGKPAFGEPEEKEITGDKCQHVSQPVPARPNIIVNPKNKRIEIVQIISKHSRGLSLKSAIVAIKTRVIPNGADGEGPHSRSAELQANCVINDTVRGPSLRSGRQALISAR